jgi:hypothetical protein
VALLNVFMDYDTKWLTEDDNATIFVGACLRCSGVEWKYYEISDVI